jgi:hypothetical protein
LCEWGAGAWGGANTIRWCPKGLLLRVEYAGKAHSPRFPPFAERLVKYVGDRVATGQQATASEVVRAGLALMIERDEAAKDSLGTPKKTGKTRHG